MFEYGVYGKLRFTLNLNNRDVFEDLSFQYLLIENGLVNLSC